MVPDSVVPLDTSSSSGLETTGSSQGAVGGSGVVGSVTRAGADSPAQEATSAADPAAVEVDDIPLYTLGSDDEDDLTVVSSKDQARDAQVTLQKHGTQPPCLFLHRATFFSRIMLKIDKIVWSWCTSQLHTGYDRVSEALQDCLGIKQSLPLSVPASNPVVSQELLTVLVFPDDALHERCSPLHCCCQGYGGVSQASMQVHKLYCACRQQLMISCKTADLPLRMILLHKNLFQSPLPCCLPLQVCLALGLQCYMAFHKRTRELGCHEQSAVVGQGCAIAHQPPSEGELSVSF